MKLTIELVPATAWYTNVRSNVSPKDWDKIRKYCYKLADNKCEICNSVGFKQGRRHAVECHEIWHYDDINKIQKLTGLIALCPNCHQTKHVGLASLQGKREWVVKQLMNVNTMSWVEADNYINESFKIWNDRSQSEWQLDISYLNEYMSNI
jgi:hypothetical protein